MGKNTALEVKDFHGRYFCGKIMAGSRRRNSGGGCGDCEMRAGILEDTLSLRVACSGTKLPAEQHQIVG